VITAQGGFSGTLWVNGTRTPVSGTMGTTITIAGMDITLYVASVTNVPGDFILQGSVDMNTVYGQRRPVFALSQPSERRGSYTMALCAPDPVDVDTTPGGDGYGTVTVSALGACTGLITLADDTKVTLSGHLGSDYEDAGILTAAWSFHRGLYGDIAKGYIAGKLTFRDSPGISDLDGTWRWVKQPNAPPVTVYNSGIDTTRQVIGSLYQAPALNQRAISGLAETNDNVWIRLAGADMSTQPAITITSKDFTGTWSRLNAITHYGPRDDRPQL